MKITSKPLALAVSSLIALASTASAQNTAFATRDLFLTFQNPGGTQGATAVLTAIAGTTDTTARNTAFRDAAPGSFTNLTNIGSALTAAFGATWFEQPTLWMAGLAHFGTSDQQTGVTNGDPQRSLYFTRARNSVGTVGEQNSLGQTNNNSSFFTVSSSGINTLRNGLEQAPGAGSFPTFQSTITPSQIDNELDFFSVGNQRPAFGTIVDGGVQDNFFAGSFGTFGSAGAVEIALDLFRMVPGTNQPGVPLVGVVGTPGIADFLGTLTINSSGAVGFTAEAAPIPEPTTGLVGAVTMLFAATLRRRKVVA